LLGCLCVAGRATDHQRLGTGHGPDPGRVHDHGPDRDLPAGVATGMDGNHRDFHAHLPAAAGPLPDRPVVLRSAGGAEPANSLPVTTRGHVGLLPEGGLSATRDAEPDLRRDATVHGHTDYCHRAAVCVPGHRLVAARGAVLTLSMLTR